MNSLLYKISTEADCDGLNMRTIGYFYGTMDQVATHLAINGIEPYYYFHTERINPVDCTDINEDKFVPYNTDKYGRFTIVKTEELRLAALKAKALAKLTLDERAALGL